MIDYVGRVGAVRSILYFSPFCLKVTLHSLLSYPLCSLLWFFAGGIYDPSLLYCRRYKNFFRQLKIASSKSVCLLHGKNSKENPHDYLSKGLIKKSVCEIHVREIFQIMNSKPFANYEKNYGGILMNSKLIIQNRFKMKIDIYSFESTHFS